MLPLNKILQELEKPHLCPDCKEVTIEHPGLCDKCADVANSRTVSQVMPQQPRETIIPPDMRWARFDSALLAERVSNKCAINLAVSAAERFKVPTPRSVIFCGPTGVGKTSLAAAIMRKLEGFSIAQNAFWIKANDLGRARMDSPLGEEPKAVRKARKASLLVLDDLGGECNQGIEVIRDVVHYRRDYCLPTIYTTWATDEQLSACYGEGVARRILEFSDVIAVRKMP